MTTRATAATIRTNEMIRTNIIIGLLALAFFANAQYQGWNLFERDAGAQTSRLSGSSSRAYHK